MDQVSGHNGGRSDDDDLDRQVRVIRERVNELQAKLARAHRDLPKNGEPYPTWYLTAGLSSILASQHLMSVCISVADSRRGNATALGVLMYAAAALLHRVNNHFFVLEEWAWGTAHIRPDPHVRSDGDPPALLAADDQFELKVRGSAVEIIDAANDFRRRLLADGHAVFDEDEVGLMVAYASRLTELVDLGQFSGRMTRNVRGATTSFRSCYDASNAMLGDFQTTLEYRAAKGGLPLDADARPVAGRSDGIQPFASPPAHNRTGDAEAVHSADFSTVSWYGVPYTFSPIQARIVTLLWAEWVKREGLGLRESTIADAVDLGKTFRLGKTFKGHPALNSMIVPGEGRGTFRLADPQSPENPPSIPERPPGSRPTL